MTYDAVVLGGGFYGCKVALALHNLGLTVAIVEPHMLMRGATEVNQGRVHSGMHYPRFFQTALSAAKHYRRFLTEHASAMVQREHIYAIAHDSKTDPAEFERVAREIRAPIRRLPVASLFNQEMIAASYRVDEIAFDVVKLRAMIADQLHIANIDIIKGYGCIECEGKLVRVEYHDDDIHFLHTNYVFNCTYARLDKTAPVRTKLKKEWAEVAIVQAPPELINADITVMDGPYWSLMYHPPTGKSALTHVTHTPHFEWFNSKQHPPLKPETNFVKMRDDAARFVPSMASAMHIRSMWTTRVVLAQNEEDDGRPILWEYAADSPRIISILGSKFNSIYDAVDEVERGEWVLPARKTGVLRRGRAGLVGYTGFVGSNLMGPGRWTDLSNSTTPLAPGHYDYIVCTALKGTKWWANAHPEQDYLMIEKLKRMLERVTTDEFILVSTIDALAREGAYADHRFIFENWVKQQFPKVRIIRLPALFGPGMKKNPLFDLLHHNQFPVNLESTYQWYPLTRLWDDIQRIREEDVTEVNLVTPPITMRWIIENLFRGRAVPQTIPVSYSVTDPRGYVMTEAEIKAALKEFIDTWTSPSSSPSSTG